MKRIIAIILTVSMLLSATGLAYAKPDSVSEKQEEKQMSVAQKKFYQNQMKENKRIALENKKENNSLNAQNSTLREDLEASLELITQEGIELPEELLGFLEDYSIQVGQLTEELKLTQNGIGNLINKNNNYAKEKDYMAMSLAFEEMYEIQNFRNEILAQINEYLISMIREIALYV